MDEKHLYDITQVCNMFGVTSRTLRFYEEKGIIQSTVIGISSRRQYTEEQVCHIQNVLVLRTLGLSINAISELQGKETDLKNAVLSKRAEIYASMDTHIRELNLLNEALFALEAGKNIYAEEWHHLPDQSAKEKHIAEICSMAIINGDTDTLYKYLSSRLAQYMPKDVYMVVRKDTLSPIGNFICFDKTTVDENHSNKIYRFIRFSKFGLKITFVFCDCKVDGLWFGYYDTNKR